MQVYNCSWECFTLVFFRTVACFFERGRDRDRMRTPIFPIYDLMAFAYEVANCVQVYIVRGWES
jgi:hypothetical protein